MEREEREMDLWQRAYDRGIDRGGVEGARREADEALKAFNEAFPSSPAVAIERLWGAMSPRDREVFARTFINPGAFR